MIGLVLRKCANLDEEVGTYPRWPRLLEFFKRALYGVCITGLQSNIHSNYA